MAELSREDVVIALGAVDDEVIDGIIAAGITPIELAEARVWLVVERALREVGAGRRPPADGVGRVVAILDQHVDANVQLAPEPHPGSDSFLLSPQGPAAPVILGAKVRPARQT